MTEDDYHTARGTVRDTRDWDPDATQAKVEKLLRDFEYDTAHYTTEKLGDHVYFDAQLHDLVDLIIRAVKVRS